MNDTQVGLLALQVAVSVVVILAIGWELLRTREERLKYRLFAVRDQLLYLVATGELSESSPIFRVFYGAINGSINEIREVTLISLVRATMRARSELEKGAKEHFDQEISAASPNTKKAVSQFCETMMEITLANSLWLVILLHLAKHSHRVLTNIDRVLKLSRLFSAKREQYDTYRFFEGFGCPHGAT